MNGDVKRYIYIIGVICAVFIVGKAIIDFLPWLILIGLIFYVSFKITGFMKKKKEIKEANNANNSNDKQSYSMKDDDYTNGEIIDVEYEDVDNKKE